MMRICIGCSKQYKSQDPDLCSKCSSDFGSLRTSKGRVPMPPPSSVMEDSRTQRSRTRGDAGRAAMDDVCGQCNGSGRFKGSTCGLCGGDGYGDSPTGGVNLLKDSDVCRYCDKVLTPEEQNREDADGYPLELGSCDSCAAPYIESHEMAKKMDALWAEHEEKARRGEHCYGCGKKFEPPYEPGKICDDCNKRFDDTIRELYGREPQDGDEL